MKRVELEVEMVGGVLTDECMADIRAKTRATAEREGLTPAQVDKVMGKLEETLNGGDIVQGWYRSLTGEIDALYERLRELPSTVNSIAQQASRRGPGQEVFLLGRVAENLCMAGAGLSMAKETLEHVMRLHAEPEPDGKTSH